MRNAQRSYVEAAVTAGALERKMGHLITGPGNTDDISIVETPIIPSLKLQGTGPTTFFLVIQILGTIWNLMYPAIVIYLCWIYRKYRRDKQALKKAALLRSPRREAPIYTSPRA